MDDAVYEYRDGRNLLTLRKNLQANPEDALTKTMSGSPLFSLRRANLKQTASNHRRSL